MNYTQFNDWLTAQGLDCRSIREVRFTAAEGHDPSTPIECEVDSYLTHDDTEIPGHPYKGVGTLEGRRSQGKFGLPVVTTRHAIKYMPGTQSPGITSTIQEMLEAGDQMSRDGLNFFDRMVMRAAEMGRDALSHIPEFVPEGEEEDGAGGDGTGTSSSAPDSSTDPSAFANIGSSDPQNPRILTPAAYLATRNEWAAQQSANLARVWSSIEDLFKAPEYTYPDDPQTLQYLTHMLRLTHQLHALFLREITFTLKLDEWQERAVGVAEEMAGGLDGEIEEFLKNSQST